MWSGGGEEIVKLRSSFVCVCACIGVVNECRGWMQEVDERKGESRFVSTSFSLRPLAALLGKVVALLMFVIFLIRVRFFFVALLFFPFRDESSLFSAPRYLCVGRKAKKKEKIWKKKNVRREGKGVSVLFGSP